VLGQSQDASNNGGVNVGVMWTGFAMDSVHGDTLALTASRDIADFAFTTADLTPAKSILPPVAAIDAFGSKYVCPTRTSTFGANGALGTPGAKNEPCYPYGLVSIPEALEDISASGTGLFRQYTIDAYTRVDLSSAPFSYYGAQKPAMWVDIHGALSFVDPGNYNYANQTAPASSLPWAMIAPFWDDISFEAANAQVYVAYLPAVGPNPGRWLLQYSHVTQSFGTDDLNFEVKLFDDGVVEFHYADMISSSFPSGYADGSTATIWLCAPDFTSALPIGINKAVLQPHTAYRFIPNP
jgi:hypothetical protein